MSNHIPYHTADVITYPYRILILVLTGVSGSRNSSTTLTKLCWTETGTSQNYKINDTMACSSSGSWGRHIINSRYSVGEKGIYVTKV